MKFIVNKIEREREREYLFKSNVFYLNRKFVNKIKRRTDRKISLISGNIRIIR